MKFSELLKQTVEDAEIPLRFEPGAAESVVRPVVEMLRVWVAAHDPDPPRGEFDYGKKALIVQLLDELDDKAELGVTAEP